MTPRERVYAALRGERVDRIPFTIYGGLLPRSETERLLRNEGLCLVDRIPVFSCHNPTVEFERREFWCDGRLWVRQSYWTPVGEVTELLRTGGGYGTSLRQEFLIKRPPDYDVLRYIVAHEVYTPAYDEFLAHQAMVGDDIAVIGNLGYSPFQQILIMWAGPERMAIDMMECPGEVHALYDILTDRHREQYELAANSPAEFFIYGDNVTAEMVGVPRFERYIAPRYNEFAEVLHAKGKRLGSHLDGKMGALADAVNRTGLDFIEAFSAAPDGDLELSAARRAWSEKVIWTNFPSPLHLAPSTEIEAYCQQMLRDVAPGDRLLVGVTENIPEGSWQRSLPVVSGILAREGRLPLAGC